MNQPTPQPITADTYARRLAETTCREMAFCATDTVAFRHWRCALRGRLVEQLGIAQIAVHCCDAPAAVKRGEWREQDHVREEWELVAEPGFHVPFFLLRPTEGSGPRPLVLTPHGHSGRGRFIYSGLADSQEMRAEMLDGERDIALQAVRQGYIAIAPEARAFGESRGCREVERDAVCSCRDWQMRALMFGRTLIGERVWDIMRLIDWAATRRDIDGSRIAITGNSGGGTVALFAAALDERIRVAVPGSYFCTFLDSIGSIPHCPCNYIPGIAALAEMADVAGLIAPRPLLVVTGREDPIFPIAATREAFAQLQHIYDVAGVKDRCDLFEGDGGHRYYKEPVWPFVARWI